MGLATGLGACGQGDSNDTDRPATAAITDGMPAEAGTAAAPPTMGIAGGDIDNPQVPFTPPTVVPAAGGGPGICEIAQLSAEPRIPQMMIVLDRSGSMQEGQRWGPSASAVKRLTTMFESRIDFGLTMFPAPSNGGGSGDPADCFMQQDPITCLQGFAGSCEPGSILEPAVPNNSAAISAQLDRSRPAGGTPTSGTLEDLLQSWAVDTSGPIDPDAEPAPGQYVLLVTDGQPTCPAGNGSATTPADIDASNAALDALTAAGVETYVIGYDTQADPALAQVLDGFAMRGGTGDTQHRPVEDEASLFAEFETITGAIASCSFTLNSAPSRADYVLVELDGNQLNLDDADGWQLVGDRTIELQGQACATFKSPGLHSVEANVQCEVVRPL